MKPSQVWVRRPYAPGAIRRTVTRDDYDVLLAGDCDVFKPDGKRLCSLRRGAVSEKSASSAFWVLDQVRMGSLNRGDAAGEQKTYKVREDGHQSRTQEASRRSPSSIIGYLGRTPRTYFCRQLSFNAQHPELFARLLDYLGEVSTLFEHTVPERFRQQMLQVRATPPQYVIDRTPWTTITVNHNWATRLHVDKGDSDVGFSTIVCFRRGSYTGGELVFPAYRIAVDLSDRDVLFMDAHEAHGNVDLVLGEGAQRTTTVLYFRSNMTRCLPPEQELERAKQHTGALEAPEEDDDAPDL